MLKIVQKVEEGRYSEDAECHYFYEIFEKRKHRKLRHYIIRDSYF